jgi:membrane-bound lytic murein transglycosylase D
MQTPREVFPLTTIPFNQQRPLPTEQLSEKSWADLKAKILSDSSDRLSGEFKISDGLRERAEFWFDIYTRYGEAHHVIHHMRFPWIVFEVVDATDLVIHSKGPLWLRRERGDKLAKKRIGEIRAALTNLSRKKHYDQLPRLEQKLFEVLAKVPGTRKQVFKFAAQNLRSQLGQRDFFQRGLVNSSKYLTYMEEEFHKAGLPTELTRMPFVESSFNEAAYSKVGASGIWQIMPKTGKSYMIVNDHIDERNSPLKATVAAARLLRFYNRTLGSWPLAITAYNNGIGNIKKAIKSAQSKDLDVIIERYHKNDFRFASSNFYTCFLAALYAEKYHELLFENIQREPLRKREEVRLAEKTKVRRLPQIMGVSHEELLSYNLDLQSAFKSGATIPAGYRLHLPPNMKKNSSQRVGRQDPKDEPKS